MEISSKFNSVNSRYNKTPLFEKNINSKNPKRGQVIYYGATVFPYIPKTEMDIYITLKKEHIGRFDLLSYSYYGTCELWWVIALTNNVKDVFDDENIGKNIRIPPFGAFSNILGLTR